MASFEDYDEFGNYIGADLDSDDEEEEIAQQQFQRAQPTSAPLEGFEDEIMEDVPDNALMQIDGEFRSFDVAVTV